MSLQCILNPLSDNITKWSNTLKQFVHKLQRNCLSVIDHFVRLALKGLIDNSVRKSQKLQNDPTPPHTVKHGGACAKG